MLDLPIHFKPKMMSLPQMSGYSISSNFSSVFELYSVSHSLPEPGISLIILPLMTILQRNLKLTTDTFLFISHTMNVILFKFHYSIFIVVRIIKEMPGSVASGNFNSFLTLYPITH